MSVDIAVWEGSPAVSHAEAARTFEDLYERYVESDDTTEPTAGIRNFVALLLDRYADLTELDDDAVDDSPWAEGPLIGNASGPFFYFSVVTNEAGEQAWPFIVETARACGLVCFDPQSSELAT